MVRGIAKTRKMEEKKHSELVRLVYLINYKKIIKRKDREEKVLQLGQDTSPWMESSLTLSPESSVRGICCF